MNWDQRHQAEGDGSGDQLDALLADAAWPDVDGPPVARLHQQWAGIVRRRTRQRRVVTVAALIGCLTSGVAFYQFRAGVTSSPDIGPSAGEQLARDLHQPRPAGDVVAPGVAGQSGPTKSDTLRGGPDPVAVAVAAARSAAAQAVLMTLDRRMQPRPEPGHGKGDAAVDGAIAEVTAAEQPDMEAIADRLRADRRRNQQRLTVVIQRGEGPSREAALRLLSRIASPRSLPLLLDLLQDPEVRREPAAVDLVHAVARLADATTLYRLAKAELAPAVRHQWMAALLDRGGQRPVAMFLSLAEDPATAVDALAALDQVTTPPVDTLLQFFAAPRVARRHAAAVVLGRLPHPAISKPLVAMVLRGRHEREALMALSARRDPLATEFIGRAYHDMALTALVRSAQLGLKSLPTSEGG